jgi:hypothetical protein
MPGEKPPGDVTISDPEGALPRAESHPRKYWKKHETLRKARPRRIEYNLDTQSRDNPSLNIGCNINDSTAPLQIPPAAR